jgi:hypothetical protein
MKLERLHQIIDAYGAREEAWPAAERAAARELLAREPAARRLVDDAAVLDSWLDSYTLGPPPSAVSLLDRLPPRDRPERLLAWLLPRSLGDAWRPALAAALPLALGIVLGAGTDIAANEDWEYQERYLVSAPLLEDPS